MFYSAVPRRRMIGAALEWMGLAAGYELGANTTDFGVRVGLLEDFAAYEQHLVYGSLGLYL